MDVCAYALSAGEKYGADELEAVLVKNRTTTVEAELGQISTASKITSEELRIRVIKDKSLGSGVTYRLDKDAIKKTVKSALHAAHVSRRDEHWDSLPSPGKYSSLDVWDSSMEYVSSEDLMDPLDEIFQLFPENVSVNFAGNQVMLKERVCVNSTGIDHEDRGTLERYGVLAVGVLEQGVTPGFSEVQYLRTYSPDPQKIAESITTKVNFFKKRDTAISGTSPIILSPQALQELFYFTVFKALSGENVAREKSLLAGKEGKKVASSVFTLHDNGIIEKGINSCEMDDEGFPCQDTVLIENGVLQGFIWNDYWAKRMGKTSTGNAHYDDRGNELVIQPTTMVVSPGEYTKKDLFDVKDGYYVLGLQGAHGSNPESGDFSVLCNPVYRIRNGEISGGCTGVMISDNIFSLLHRIDAVGCEAEVVEAALLPCVRFTAVNVAAM